MAMPDRQRLLALYECEKAISNLAKLVPEAAAELAELKSRVRGMVVQPEGGMEEPPEPFEEEDISPSLGFSLDR